MFDPVKILREVQADRKMLSSLNKAEEYFDSQKNAISSISRTEGYQEIKRYWQRVWEATVVRISCLESNDVADHKALQAKMKTAQDFLDFLDNME